MWGTIVRDDGAPRCLALPATCWTQEVPRVLQSGQETNGFSDNEEQIERQQVRS